MKQGKGVLLIALGHPYYGEMAFNLAMSIKYTSPDLSITLVADGDGMRYLNSDKQKMFDRVLSMPEQYTTYKGRKNYLKPKVYLNHFTPYKQTLYLDVDMIMTPKKNIATLMDGVKGCSFTMQNRGCLDLSKQFDPNAKFMIWSTTGNIVDAFGFKEGYLYNLSSELIYFEDNETSKNIFKHAQYYFESPKVKYLDFAGGVPDELPYAIAMIKNNHYPHKVNWRPVFWEHFDKTTPQERDINQRYFAVSLGGNILPRFTRKVYQNLVTYYGAHFGVTTHVNIKDKRQFITDRATI